MTVLDVNEKLKLKLNKDVFKNTGCEVQYNVGKSVNGRRRCLIARRISEHETMKIGGMD